MGNHEYCCDCGANDYHSGRNCDPNEKRKHQNRHNPCKCKNSKLTGSRHCAECGGYQILKRKDVKDVLTRIEWIRQETDGKIQTLKRLHRDDVKRAEKERDDQISAIRARCKHEWGGFAEVYVCDKCGMTEIN